MKKYHFSLDNVLNFREQVLENLKSEHAQVLAQLAEQENRISELKEKIKETERWLHKTMEEGAADIGRIQECRYYIRRLDQLLKEAGDELARLRKMEEAKRAEVIAAKKDKASIQKLKEKSQEEYRLAYQKDEEKQIEEFVGNKRLLQMGN